MLETPKAQAVFACRVFPVFSAVTSDLCYLLNDIDIFSLLHIGTLFYVPQLKSSLAVPFSKKEIAA